MKSKTLSSDLTVFKKDITRFSPLWLTWSVMLLISGYLLYSNGHDLSDRYDIFPSEFVVANVIYGFFCAVTLFGYLFDPKECVSTHSLPIRREQLFLTHLLSGLVMHIVPCGVYYLAIAPLCENSVLPMFGYTVLQFVFFYGLGIFCVMLTGRRFAAAVMYGLLNSASMLTYAAVSTVYMPMLNGVSLPVDGFVRLCPPAVMIMKPTAQMDLWITEDAAAYTKMMLIFAAIGAGLMLLSLVLYRRRKLERAESFMAYPVLNYLFVFICTVFSGCFFLLLSSLFPATGYWVMLIIGIVIGYFASVMILKRSPAVFHTKALAGLAVIGVVMVGSILLTKADPLGYVTYVPELGDVTRIELRKDEYSDSVYFTEDPAEFEKLMQLHRDLIAQPPIDQTDVTSHIEWMQLSYELSSGETVKRFYNVQSPLLSQLHWYISQPEYQFGVQTLDELLERTTAVEIFTYYPINHADEQYWNLEGTDKQALLKILFDDSKAGNLYDSSVYDSRNTLDRVYSIHITMKEEAAGKNDRYTTHFLEVPKHAANTRAWLDPYIAATQPER